MRFLLNQNFPAFTDYGDSFNVKPFLNNEFFIELRIPREGNFKQKKFLLNIHTKNFYNFSKIQTTLVFHKKNPTTKRDEVKKISLETTKRLSSPFVAATSKAKRIKKGRSLMHVQPPPLHRSRSSHNFSFV
jgi:hypothetical protein